MGSARLLLFCTIDIKDTRRFHLSIIRPNSTVGQVPVVPELNTCPALFIYTSVSCNPQSDLPNSIESELKKKKKKRKENDVHSPKCLDNSICSRYIYIARGGRRQGRHQERVTSAQYVPRSSMCVAKRSVTVTIRIERTSRKAPTVAMMEMVRRRRRPSGEPSSSSSGSGTS